MSAQVPLCDLCLALSQVQPIQRCVAQLNTLRVCLPLLTLWVSIAAQRTGPPVPSRPVPIRLLRTVYGVVQFRNPITGAVGGGTLRACSFMSCSSAQGVKYDAFPFASPCGLVRFGRACADGQREKAHCRGPTGAASVPEGRFERLADFRPSGPTGH